MESPICIHHTNVHNVRSPQMWEGMSHAGTFSGKSVIDLGCGYADILAFAATETGSICVGIEQDPNIVAEVRQRAKLGTFPSNVIILNKTIAEVIREPASFHIGICCSVLPYLEDPVPVVKWLAENCTESYIEVQYKGDGPGYMEPQQVRDLFLSYWDVTGVVATTEVAGRDAVRHVWRCFYYDD